MCEYFETTCDGYELAGIFGRNLLSPYGFYFSACFQYIFRRIGYKIPFGVILPARHVYLTDNLREIARGFIVSVNILGREVCDEVKEIIQIYFFKEFLTADLCGPSGGLKTFLDI